MIITNDNTKAQSPVTNAQDATAGAGANEETPLLAAEPSLPPPPPYGAYSYDGISAQGPTAPEKPESTVVRFIKSLGVAIFLYLVGFGLLQLLFFAFGSRRWPLPPNWNGSMDRPLPLPKDGRVVQCGPEWQSNIAPLPIILTPGNPHRPPYSSSLSLNISARSPHLYFFARGAHSRGSITFRADSNLDGDLAKIDIVSRYSSLELRDIANICLFENDEGGKSFGILTPQQRFEVPPRPTSQIFFEIVVRFPSKPGQIRTLGTLDTHLPSFHHALFDLEGRIVFESLSLFGTESGIQADFVSAHTATLQTTSKPITGKFNVTEELVLKTTNAPIKVQVELFNERRFHKASRITMQSTNSPIEARVSMYSIDDHRPEQYGGIFDVAAVTTNGVIKLDVPQLPFNPHLQLQSRTTNGAVGVTVHPTYEGRLMLRTTNYIPHIEVDYDVKDPSGRGLQREYHIDRVVRGAVDASLWWGEEKDHREFGHINLDTTNSPIALHL
jgi:hypothetical protein